MVILTTHSPARPSFHPSRPGARRPTSPPAPPSGCPPARSTSNTVLLKIYMRRTERATSVGRNMYQCNDFSIRPFSTSSFPAAFSPVPRRADRFAFRCRAVTPWTASRGAARRSAARRRAARRGAARGYAPPPVTRYSGAAVRRLVDVIRFSYRVAAHLGVRFPRLETDDLTPLSCAKLTAAS